MRAGKALHPNSRQSLLLCIVSVSWDAQETREGEENVSSKLFRGTYVSGLGHSGRRPRLYESLRLWQGTINIKLPGNTDMRDLIPCDRTPGIDPFDFEENQDFLVRPCKLKGVHGYQLLPINKTTGEPRGHHASKVIEISLKERIELKPNEELEVELEGFG